MNLLEDRLQPIKTLLNGAIFGALAVCANQAFALNHCGDSVSTYSVESLQVRLAGETEFHEADSDNFCYTTQDLALGSDLNLYIVSIYSIDPTIEPDYPPGTEFKLSVWASLTTTDRKINLTT